MRNLRTQLLLSHLVLVMLMTVVLIGGLVAVSRLGRSIDRILRDNYKSVIAAQNMKEALERIDSAATFYLAGQPERAREQFARYSPVFEQAYATEAGNITERGERETVARIGAFYERRYRPHLELLLSAQHPMPQAEARRFYFGSLQGEFIALKADAQSVLDLNQRAIERADLRARQQARITVWLGAGVSMATVLLGVFFALRMIGAALAPLRTLGRQAQEIGAGHLNHRIELHRSDEIGALAAAFNDMTEKLREARRLEEERLRRAERMSDAALDSLYDPVLVTDSVGRVVHMNPAAQGLFGPVLSAAGAPVGEVVPEARIAQAIDHAARSGNVTAPEDEAGFIPLKSAGRERIYRFRATPMRDDEGHLLGAVAVLEDVTHLRELDRLKSQFVGVASHELRTPVTSLLLSVQLLEEGAAGELSATQREVVAAQRQDLERLERMMADLLDITRLEAGVTPPRLELVDPADLVKAAVEHVASAAEAKGVHLATEVVPGLPRVKADRGQIQRVLLNLLNNAIRHTEAGGAVTVGACDLAASVRFEVADTGSGIPPDYVDRVFDRFVQVPGATRGGAGLGLSIARTIAEAHLGTLSVESELGIGSRFVLTLPAPDAGKEM